MIGDNIKSLRRTHDLTQPEFAKMFGISRNSLRQTSVEMFVFILKSCSQLRTRFFAYSTDFKASNISTFFSHWLTTKPSTTKIAMTTAAGTR